MLNLIGEIVGMAAILINVTAIVNALALTTRQRLAVAGSVGVWVGLASAAAATGKLAFDPGNPVPIIGLFVAVPFVAMAVAWNASRTFREKLLSIPTPLLIQLNSLRMLGGIFLLLAMAGRLSGPFPYFAGIGDMITGAFAFSVAALAARGTAPGRIIAWSIFGALDLFAAVGLGITSANGSPIQLLHVGVGSAAIQQLPFSLVPTVLVPFYLITHFIVFAKRGALAVDRPDELGGRSVAVAAAIFKA